MKNYSLIILILASVILLIFVTLGINKFKEITAEQKNTQKARFCHYCHYAYVHKTHEDYKYCPTCGNRLRTIDDIPSNVKDFDFDTWLENQPEGTFVQGGGIDEENSSKSDKKD